MKRLGAAIAILGLMTAGAAAQMQQGGSSSSGASRAGGERAYCLIRGDGSKNCGFQTMAACEDGKTGATDKCMPNTGATTGSGGSMDRNMNRGGSMNRGGMPSDRAPSGTPGE